MALKTTRYVPRQRPLAPARVPAAPVSERFAAMREVGLADLAQPFFGITTDGTLRPGLFSLKRTGVSTAPIRDAADAFLACLSEEQRARVQFPLDAEEWRQWSNVHAYMMRHGVLLEELNDAQRARALDVPRASLSARGFETARDVMRLNETLRLITGRDVETGEWLYWLSIFGTPSADQPWGWQFDGHHLNLNCLILGDQLVLTPAFIGSEPTYADCGPYEGARVFEEEDAKALALIRVLTPEQRARAIVHPTNDPRHLPPNRPFIEGSLQGAAFSDNVVVPYAGLPARDMTADQQAMLLDLVEVYTGRVRPGHDQVWLDEVRPHLQETHFAWFGGIGDGDTFYYRVHSPVILIEFDHLPGIALESDERPSRTHIHTVVRTPNGNDYGKDLLRQHYELHHPERLASRG